MTWLHTIPPLGSLKTCCPVIRAAPNQTPHPGSPKQNLDDIRSGGNDQITYRKLCSFNNFADGSWDLSRLPCLSSDLDEVPVLQRGYEEFNCSGGTRMWRREANLDGDVGNFIETEQLVEIEGFQSSLLQHGDDGQLSTAFSAEMQILPNLSRYFLVDAKGNILEEQKGIVRSNCIDCLDRTNVTQKSLDAQLLRTGVLDSFESISMFAEDYLTFRALWAEQGDEISLEYAGTYALKGDLVG
ncbi:hypothetical protein C1H46_034965 [Malus baccata]|uniref:SAC domain-containing protein n=1 Tax=Malus baccata TaxID=106549 RepID=A0A540KZ46_MALBA|nr:hypothetical protein C1H46_034965 [Malus baccata]